MLIEFSVTNYRSFKDPQTFSLTKASGKELENSNTFTANTPGKEELLRSTALYGPNAAGKSNLLRALYAMRQIVVSSASSKQRGDKLPVVPFKLDPETTNRPSEFEVIIVADGIRYQYGFSADEKRIHEEWLMAFPKGRMQRWFNREWDKAKQKYNWEMGSALQGQKLIWQKSTRENALFLSTAVNLNSEQLQPIYDWFRKKLRVVGASNWHLLTAMLCQQKDKKEKVLDFLKAADLDIFDVEVEMDKFDPKRHLADDLPDAVKEYIAKDMQNEDIISEIKTQHIRSDGEIVSFDLGDDESDGTDRIFSFAGPWIESLEKGFVLIVDELHNSLHPKLVKFLVQLFHSDKTNKKNAQLIFTTHETSILNESKLFRRDQVWFCEKDNAKATQLFSLTDFSARKDENVERRYLSGRYGALPFIHDYHFINS